MDFVTSSTPRARYARLCFGCGRWIDAGEVYHKHISVDEGEIFAASMHEYCARFVLKNLTPYDEYYEGDVLEMVEGEAWTDDPNGRPPRFIDRPALPRAKKEK